MAAGCCQALGCCHPRCWVKVLGWHRLGWVRVLGCCRRWLDAPARGLATAVPVEGPARVAGFERRGRSPDLGRTHCHWLLAARLAGHQWRAGMAAPAPASAQLRLAVGLVLRWVHPQVRSHLCCQALPVSCPAACCLRLHHHPVGCHPAAAVAAAAVVDCPLAPRCPVQRVCRYRPRPRRRYCQAPRLGCHLRLSRRRCRPHLLQPPPPQVGKGSAACCTACPLPGWCCLGWVLRRRQTQRARWPGWSTQTHWTQPCSSAVRQGVE